MRFDGIRRCEGYLPLEAVQRNLCHTALGICMGGFPYLDDGRHASLAGRNCQITAHGCEIRWDVYDVYGLVEMQPEQFFRGYDRPYTGHRWSTLRPKPHLSGRICQPPPFPPSGALQGGIRCQHPYLMSSLGQALRLPPDSIFSLFAMGVGILVKVRQRFPEDECDFHMADFSGSIRAIAWHVHFLLNPKSMRGVA